MPNFSDSFNRTVSGGWGTTDSGQTWTRIAGWDDELSVSEANGYATVALASGGHPKTPVRQIELSSFDAAPIELIGKIRVHAIPTVGSTEVYLRVCKGADATAFYEFILNWRTLDSLASGIRRSPNTLISGPTWSAIPVLGAGTWVRFRCKIGNTRLRLKVWKDGDSEPSTWTNEATDATHSDADLSNFRFILAPAADPPTCNVHVDWIAGGFGDTGTALLDLQASGAEEHVGSDSAIVTLALAPSATEGRATTDSATGILALVPSATDVYTGSDDATVTLAFTPLTTETGICSDGAVATLAFIPSAGEASTTRDATTAAFVLTVWGEEHISGPVEWIDSGTVTLHLTITAVALRLVGLHAWIEERWSYIIGDVRYSIYGRERHAKTSSWD